MVLFVALVTASLAAPVVPMVAGQAKVEVLKGGKRRAAVKTETTVQVAPNSAANDAKAVELSRKSSELDAKAKALDAKQAELEAREAKADEQRERDEALRKKLEKLGAQNRAAWQDAANSLAGE